MDLLLAPFSVAFASKNAGVSPAFFVTNHPITGLLEKNDLGPLGNFLCIDFHDIDPRWNFPGRPGDLVIAR